MPAKLTFDPAPLGVPLAHIQTLLRMTPVKVSRDADDSLTAKNKGAVTKLKVLAPEGSEAGKIKAVIQVTTELKLPGSFFEPEKLKIFNQAAVAGAITIEDGRCFIGSRLTVLEDEVEWGLHLPFLLLTLVSGSESHLGAIRKVMGVGHPTVGKSSWRAEDFKRLQSQVFSHCVCTTKGLGFTAELELREGSTNAVTCDHYKALLRLSAKEPHPELGGGLLCVLQMPHNVAPERLADIAQDLNRREMAPTDQAPHFGAWCEGDSETTLAYTTFLPNLIHRTENVALNIVLWSLLRAYATDDYLTSIGVS